MQLASEALKMWIYPGLRAQPAYARIREKFHARKKTYVSFARTHYTRVW